MGVFVVALGALASFTVPRRRHPAATALVVTVPGTAELALEPVRASGDG